ncbi:alpha subunit of putative sulfite reductase [Rhypophila decipiens]|uniref:NADPH--hemoprotein reductase n=1 Tax=Rhypophila decipiens TaxID=261697 RepID=A0AAN6Y3F6_9PEZI|nr:alpha subunit of putative sulfite reductase [Rhypophila decipiens]
MSACPVSGMAGGTCPAGSASGRSQVGPRGCSFSGYCQPGDIHAAFDIPRGVDAEEWLRMRERKSINEVLYRNFPSVKEIEHLKNIDTLTASDHDLLAVALGAPARQVMIRAEEIGPATGWKDGYLSAEHGFCPPDYNESPGALANSPGRIWSDLCERIPGCVARGKLRESVAALPLVQGTEDVIPDKALWAAVVALGMICSIYRYEDKNDGNEGVTVNPTKYRPDCEMGDGLGEEMTGIPLCVALPYWQISRRMGRAIPHLTFPDQASYNMKIRDPTSTYPYVGRFDNMDMRWPVFGERTEIAFQKGCADTSASFQHGPDAIAAAQEHVMNRNNEGLLRELIRLKEILERMPNAFHTINTNPNSGENYVPGHQWVRWGKFSAPLSKRCPASSGLQFPPFLVMDAFLRRKKYDSFLGAEGLHLRAWMPSNLRAFIAAVELHYSIPDYVKQSGDPRLMGVFEGILEIYCGSRGFLSTHSFKVFGILEVASKSGRTETNGGSGAADGDGRPWEETHRQFNESMKERILPYRDLAVEPHEMRGTFEECRYKARLANRSFVDADPNRSIAMVTLDIQNTGITFQPGDRLAVMPFNSWGECAKVAAALGLGDYLDHRVPLTPTWKRFSQHLASISHTSQQPELTVKDILRRGHLSPITKELALKIHHMLRASSNTVLQVLATEEWPVRASLGDLLQCAVTETNPHIWDRAFDLSGDLSWLTDLIAVEVPRTYSISTHSNELLPSTVDLTISRAEYKLCSTFAGDKDITSAGVGSGFLNPFVNSSDEMIETDEEILVGVSRPLNFQLPLDRAAPCAFFAGGSGIAPFRSFWQARMRAHHNPARRDILYLGVQCREKFCYEDELRDYMEAGLMEVHLAFSRDSRGLVYDQRTHDLVEKEMPPRYIDALIVEQGATISELVMSKKQGGLGGYLYVCGSVSVFDSVMNGIRKALYNHCSATMESADIIISKAFAERRFMLDVFMTPKPLPCNLPTISLSQLGRHTGHRPDSRMWIAVHGSVYDVTDFCPMHPGGTLIIKSNAGVDCSKTFDNLAHTNNPEVSSLLTKYFIGHLTPKPDFHASQDLSDMYDMWSSYLRTTVETLVAHQFEMYEIMGASDDGTSNEFLRGSENVWSRENSVNIGLGVRMFYDYQSRLLQGGFSALFGPKLHELVLKLSFALADVSSAGTDTRLPDVLGTIARAKTSSDAVATSQEVALVGRFLGENSSNIRFAEKGVFNYAAKSVQLDIEFLEDIREEACHGMDAFESVMAMDAQTDDERVIVLFSFLMQTLERMAKRLQVFYNKLAQYKVYQPTLEKNPARARWNLVRRRVFDGSFFTLTAETVLGAAPAYASNHQAAGGVDFDGVMKRIQDSLRNAPQLGPAPQSLNAMHLARATTPPTEMNAMARHENNTAVRAMSSFIDKNKRAIRRLSKMPSVQLTFEQIQAAVEQQDGLMGMMNRRPPTPPSSTNESPMSAFMKSQMANGSLHGPSSSASRASSMERMMSGLQNRGRALNSRMPVQQSASLGGMGNIPGAGRSPPTPPLDATTALEAMMGKLNVRRSGSVPPSPAMSLGAVSEMGRMGTGLGIRPGRSMSVRSVSSVGGNHHHYQAGQGQQSNMTTTHGKKLSSNSLRSFMLGSGNSVIGGNSNGGPASSRSSSVSRGRNTMPAFGGIRVAPTF